MAGTLQRWFQKGLLKKFDRVSIPVTDLHDSKDYQMGALELGQVAIEGNPQVASLDRVFGVATDLDKGDYNINDLKKVGRYTWTTKVPAGINIEGRTTENNKYGSLTVTKVGSGNDRKQVLNFGIDNTQYSRTNPGGNNPWGEFKETLTMPAEEISNPENLLCIDAKGKTKKTKSIPLGAQINNLFVTTTEYVNKIKGRNLVQLLGASNALDAFNKLRALKNYDSLMPGDYIDIPQIVVDGIGTLNNDYNNLRVEIGGLRTYYRVGDTETKDGILFVFRNCAFLHKMNPLTEGGSHTNAGGYNGCELKKILNNEFAAGLEKAIGPIKTVHRLVDTHGSWAWTAEKCWLPSEVETIGYQAWGRGGYYGGTGVQYPIYALAPEHRVKTYNGSRYWYWEGTSDSASSTSFCLVGSGGFAVNDGAGNGYGVSPAFYL